MVEHRPEIVKKALVWRGEVPERDWPAQVLPKPKTADQFVRSVQNVGRDAPQELLAAVSPIDGQRLKVEETLNGRVFVPDLKNDEDTEHAVKSAAPIIINLESALGLAADTQKTLRAKGYKGFKKFIEANGGPNFVAVRAETADELHQHVRNFCQQLSGNKERLKDRLSVSYQGVVVPADDVFLHHLDEKLCKMARKLARGEGAVNYKDKDATTYIGTPRWVKFEPSKDAKPSQSGLAAQWVISEDNRIRVKQTLGLSPDAPRGSLRRLVDLWHKARDLDGGIYILAAPEIAKRPEGYEKGDGLSIEVKWHIQDIDAQVHIPAATSQAQIPLDFHYNDQDLDAIRRRVRGEPKTGLIKKQAPDNRFGKGLGMFSAEALKDTPETRRRTREAWRPRARREPKSAPAIDFLVEQLKARQQGTRQTFFEVSPHLISGNKDDFSKTGVNCLHALSVLARYAKYYPALSGIIQLEAANDVRSLQDVDLMGDVMAGKTLVDAKMVSQMGERLLKMAETLSVADDFFQHQDRYYYVGLWDLTEFRGGQCNEYQARPVEVVSSDGLAIRFNPQVKIVDRLTNDLFKSKMPPAEHRPIDYNHKSQPYHIIGFPKVDPTQVRRALESGGDIDVTFEVRKYGIGRYDAQPVRMDFDGVDPDLKPENQPEVII